MKKLSASQRKFLKEATTKYNEALPGSPAESYLATRGLADPTTASMFALGYVADPLPGHEIYQGMLAIPYMRPSHTEGWQVVSIRFRKIVEGSKGKYQTIAGDRPRLFNTFALIRSSPTVCITEGELDAITAQMCGAPAVGVPGATSWQPYFREPFIGYRTVFVLADGDEPGMKFAHTVAKSLPNSKVIPMPTGDDVNSLVRKQGARALLERLK